MTDGANSSETLKRTPLFELHSELGGKMVPFAGYEMPVQYPLGVLKEHLHTREKAGLFDVSHMGQAFLTGPDHESTAAALEALGGGGGFIVIGKPSETIYLEALKSIGVPAQESLFISDDPEADLVTASRLGMRTAFVLSGKHADHGVLARLAQVEEASPLVGKRAPVSEELRGRLEDLGYF